MSEHGIKTDSDKTRCIADWPTPSCLQDLKQFLGLASYYRRFVRNFAPLVKLTEKGHVWHWSSDCDAAFLQLKERLVIRIIEIAYSNSHVANNIQQHTHNTHRQHNTVSNIAHNTHSTYLCWYTCIKHNKQHIHSAHHSLHANKPVWQI